MIQLCHRFLKKNITLPVAAIVGIIISISWSSQSSRTGRFVSFYPRKNIYCISYILYKILRVMESAAIVCMFEPPPPFSTWFFPGAWLVLAYTDL